MNLEVEGIDRMYLNVYQPRLQTDRGVAAFFRFNRGATFASSALMDPISKSFIAAVDCFVKQEQIPLITLCAAKLPGVLNPLAVTGFANTPPIARFV